MRKINISTRLFLGFSLLIVLLLGMSSIGAWRILDAQDDAAAIQHSQLVNTTIMQWARNVHLNGERAQAVPNITNKEVLDEFQKRMRESSEQINQYQDQVDNLLVIPEARVLFENVLTARRAYTGPRAEALKELNSGNEEKAQQFFRNEMPALIANYIGSIEKVYEFQVQRQNNLYKDNDEENSFGLWVLGIATLISLILGPAFSFLISRSIVVPLDNAVELAATVANQDLTVSIIPEGNDELTKLQQSLGDMVNNLRNAVGNVMTGAETIALAAKEISDGNIDLSSRTDEQASSLAETAASMEEITATVRQSADNAQQANSLSKDASVTAADGGRMVEGLVNTMSEINAKAQQIADIVGVIDSIAFQTNILALNAAVEAARAGEQGRGFAVVASEVRALAQRSAASARDIAALINDSVTVITQGNEQAALTGERMQDLVIDITKVSDIVAEIDSATKEQTIGIEQINTAITQMDDVTRQNASLVQQSSAAAASLQEQADSLAMLVSQFKIDQQRLNQYHNHTYELNGVDSGVKLLS